MIKYLKEEKGFLSLIGMLLALAVTCYIFYIFINSYFKVHAPAQSIGSIGATSSVDVSAGGGISGYRSIVGGVKSTLDNADQQQQKRTGDWGQR